MIKVGICDDMKADRESCIELCQQYFKELELPFELILYESAEEVIENPKVDILLLDVIMEKMNGIELKEYLRTVYGRQRIIFVAESPEYMELAFGKNVFGFLEKPLSYSKFRKKMDCAMEDLWENKTYFYCKEEEDYETIYRKIYLKEVLYVESQGYKTLVYTSSKKGCYVSDKRITEWNRVYGERGFGCCHRCYMVNMNHVIKIGDEIELRGGIKVPLARDRRNSFRKEYKEYQLRKADFFAAMQGRRDVVRKEKESSYYTFSFTKN